MVIRLEKLKTEMKQNDTLTPIMCSRLRHTYNTAWARSRGYRGRIQGI